MSSGSKSQVTGYFYFLGSHLVTCHGPIDYMTHILSDDKIAWFGVSYGGPIIFFNQNLYGGPEKEGGLAGRYDLDMGGPTQMPNTYLALKLFPNAVPAYRGVVSLVGQANYVGTTTYLKKMGLRMSRIHVRQTGGIPQWYDERSQIGGFWAFPQAFRLALECSPDMDVMTDNGHTKLENAKTACYEFLDYLITQKTNHPSIICDLEFTAWGSSHTVTTFRDATIANINAVRALVTSTDSTGQTGSDFTQGVATAVAFFAGTITGTVYSDVFLSQGIPNISGTPAITNAQLAGAIILNIVGIKSYTFNVDGTNIDYLQFLDNSYLDGVPTLVGGDGIYLVAIIANVIQGQFDMNPAHIIRECLTDPDWGMGYQDADIDDASFMACADTMFFEEMGISILWDKQITIEDFIKQIVKHIDATLYVDRNTGKFTLKLIRLDYVYADLIDLNPSNIAKVSDFTRPSFGELTNSITVQFWDASNYRDSSVTVQDIALSQMQNATINTTVEYPGFSNADIASRVAQRDLKTLSTPIASCTVYANRDAADLNIGGVFKLTWPDYDLYGVAMRVVSIAYGDGKSNQVRITCTQDVYGLPDAAIVAPEPPYIPPSILPVPIVDQLLYEVPYLEAVQQTNQPQVDALISANLHIGLIGAAAGRPTPASINADMQVDDGSGYSHGADLNFCPTATLVSALDRMTDAFTIGNEQDLDNGLGQTNIPIGSWFQIDDEIMAIESYAAGAITVKRGVLDTVPANHDAGAKLFFWDTLATNDTTQYNEGESLDVKILPRTFSGSLTLAAATAESKVMDARMYRPYAPGDFKVNGAYFPVGTVATDLVLTWVERNRLQQTGSVLIGFKDAGIAAETGTTYRIRVINPLDSSELLNTTTAALTYTVLGSLIASWPTTTRLFLSSVRDGYDSYQAHYFDIVQPSASVSKIRVQMAALSVDFGIPANYLPWYVDGTKYTTAGDTTPYVSGCDITTTDEAATGGSLAAIAYVVDGTGAPLAPGDQPALTFTSSNPTDYNATILSNADLIGAGADTVPNGGALVALVANVPGTGTGTLTTTLNIAADGLDSWTGNVTQDYANIEAFWRWTSPGKSISTGADFEVGITSLTSGSAFDGAGYSDRYISRGETAVIRGIKAIKTTGSPDVNVPVSAYAEAPDGFEIGLTETGTFGANAYYELALNVVSNFPVDTQSTLGTETSMGTTIQHGGVDIGSFGSVNAEFWIRKIGSSVASKQTPSVKYKVEGAFPINNCLAWSAVVDKVKVIASGSVSTDFPGYTTSDTETADPAPYVYNESIPGTPAFSCTMTTTYGGAGSALYSGTPDFASISDFNSWASGPPSPFIPSWSATGSVTYGTLSQSASATGSFTLDTFGGSTVTGDYGGSDTWGIYSIGRYGPPSPIGTITWTYGGITNPDPCSAGAGCDVSSGSVTTGTLIGYRYCPITQTCFSAQGSKACSAQAAASSGMTNSHPLRPGTIKSVLIPAYVVGKKRTTKA